MKDICYFDLESTGKDPHSARIVEFCFYRRGETEMALAALVNPGVPIPAEATGIHGLADVDVATALPFAEFAQAIEEILDGAVLCGYNIRKYDTILLDAELRRCGRVGLPRDEQGRLAVDEVDLLALWHREEPRTLAGAVKRFAPHVADFESHQASQDTDVLPEVLAGMQSELPGLNLQTAEALAFMSKPEDEVDRERKFKKRDDGVVVFAFGKHADQPVARHMDYVGWMLGADFSDETKSWCRHFQQLVAQASTK